MSELSKLSELSILRVDDNNELKWVSYLKSNNKLKYLYFGTSNESQIIASEISQLSTIFKNCGLNKSYPGKYGLVMLDSEAEELEVNLRDQTITKDQFEAIGNYKNIKWLDLYDVKIQNSETDKAIVTKKEDINKLATDVLKKLKNLKYLRIRSSSGKSFSNFNDLTFLKGENVNDASDDIDLIELDCLYTKVSTQEEIEGKWVDYDNGLKLLNTKREGLDTLYCSGMTNLNCSEEHTDFSSISDFTCRIAKTAPQSYFNTTGYRGLFCYNVKAMSTVSGCTDLTAFCTSVGLKGIVYDFSNCNKLTKVHINYAGNSAEWILPSSCTYANLDNSGGSAKFDLSRCRDIELVMNQSNEAAAVNLFKGFDRETTVKSVSFKGKFGDQCIDFSMFKEAYESREEEDRFKVKIKKFIITSYNNLTVTSLNGFEYIEGLEELEIQKDGLNNLQDINALESQKSTLKKISIIDCPVIDCQVISKLEKLEYLDLTNNNLQPSRPIKLFEGDTNTSGDSWDTLKEICDRMSKNSQILGKKVTLKLKGNSKIINWKYYEDNKDYWDKNSTYGSN